MGLLVVAGLVWGTVLYKQEITGLVRHLFSGQEKVTDKKKNVRGTIYDRSFKELALSLDRVSLYVRPRDLEDVHGSAGQLATVLGMNEQELLDRLDKDAQRVWLAKDISLEEEKAVADLHLSGVFLHREQVRFYPYKSVAAHVIGFADQNMGLAGVEHYYNRALDQASISQEDYPRVDLDGHYKTGISGQHLVLTIDLKIQDFIEKYVAALGAVHEGMEITALLMETETGAIVAYATYPSFDPNKFYQYREKTLANILLEPVVIPREIRGFFQEATMLQAGWDHEQIYPWSITSGSADAGAVLRLGERLGLNHVPGLDFSAPYVRRDLAGPAGKDVVPAGAAGTMPLQATPMQILLGMNTLLNGGHQVLPHVLDRILERNGEHEYSLRSSATVDGRGRPDGAETMIGGIGAGPDPVSHPASAEICRLLAAQGHKGVLDSFFVDVSDLSFQPVDKGSEYLRTRMMFAMLPADRPELILMVMVRQPYLEPSLVSLKDDVDLAGPAGRILPSMVALQQVHKNLSDMMSMSERKEGNYQQEQEKKALVGLENILEQHQPLMPDLTNMSLRKALRLLQDKKVKVRIQGSGRVVAQNPAPGRPLGGVKACLLTLKEGEHVDKETPAGSQVMSDGKIKNKIERIKNALRN
jgi:cell division protein FtsI (penicillin-binding protein 3)